MTETRLQRLLRLRPNAVVDYIAAHQAKIADECVESNAFLATVRRAHRGEIGADPRPSTDHRLKKVD